MHSLAERVLSHIRRQELVRAGDRVGVAVSGGIDSVALLQLLLELRGELGIVLSVVHFNHKLRGAESDADQEFVAGMARAYDLEFHADSDDVARRAAEERVSVEAAARELRYGFFRHLLGSDEGDASTTGAKAPTLESGSDRSAESAAPPKIGPASQSGPQGLKPDSVVKRDGAAESRALSKHAQDGQVKIPTLSQRTREGWGTQLPHFDKIVTGHTLDDQAETVLMRLIRGAGLRGLGGIYPRIVVENDADEACGEIVRPLLGIRRRELERYLKDIGQPWREDSTNADASLTRNRVRKLVVPLLEKEFNPAVAGNLAELAEIARGEEDYWENEVAGWMGTAVHWSEPAWAQEANPAPLIQIAPSGDMLDQSNSMNLPTTGDLQARIAGALWLVMNASVSRLWLLGEPVAVQRRLIKAIGEQAGIPLEFKHVEEILTLAAGDARSGREMSLPLGWKVLSEGDELVFVTPDLRMPHAPQDYEYELQVPGQVAVGEAGSVLEALRVPAGSGAGYNPDQLLDAELLPGPLRVRNWRAGDRFWPAHTKSPKKIKELLQERRVAQPERRFWPVVVSGDEIVWVRGFPGPAKLRAKPGREAIVIRENPLSGKAATTN